MLMLDMYVVCVETLTVIKKQISFELFLRKYLFINKSIGIKQNDFVDPKNTIVKTGGDMYTEFFNWGSTWRVNDDAPDTDPSV